MKSKIAFHSNIRRHHVLFLLALCLAGTLSTNGTADQGTEPPQFRLETGGHTASVQKAYFLDDETVVSIGYDKTLRRWKLEQTDAIADHISAAATTRYPCGDGKEGIFNSAALNQAKHLLAINEVGIHNTGVIRIVNPADGKQVRDPLRSSTPVRGLAFNPDGNRLAVIEDMEARIYDTASWQVIHTRKEKDDKNNKEVRYTAVSYSPDGSDLILCRSFKKQNDPASKTHGQVFRCNTANWKEKEMPLVDQSVASGEILCLAWSKEALAIGDDDGNLVIWPNGQHPYLLAKKETSILSVAFSPDGNRLAAGMDGTVDKDGSAGVWRIKDKALLQEFQDHHAPVASIEFSPRGNRIASGDSNGRILIWDPETGNVSFNLCGEGIIASDIAWTKPGSGLVWKVGKEENYSQAFDLQEMKPIRPPSNKDIMSNIMQNGKVREQDSKDGKWRELWLDSTEGTLGPIENFAPITDPKLPAKRLLAGPNSTGFVINAGGEVVQYDFKTKKKINTFNSDQSPVLALAISPKLGYLAAACSDQRIRIWNLSSLPQSRQDANINPFLCIYVGNDDKWVIWNPETGYYAASAYGGDDLIRWQINQGGNKPPEFVSAYQCSKLYKRADFLIQGFINGKIATALDARTMQQAAAHTPKIREILLDGHTIAPGATYETGKSTVKVEVQLEGSETATQAHTDVRVNGRSRDIFAEEPELPDAPGDEKKLANGLNTIQVVVENEFGSSIPFNIKVRCTAGPARGNLYVLAIGVNTYGEKIRQLQYAANDADQIAGFFAGQQGRLFDSIQIKKLLDRDATKANVELEFEALKGKVTRNDTLVVFVAGHGFQGNKPLERGGPQLQKQDYYFAPCDFNLNDREHTGVKWSVLLDKLTHTVSRNTVLFVDTCYSGGVDDLLGSEEGIEDLLAASHIICFTASSARERSWEDPLWHDVDHDGQGHGAFTHALLQTLKGKAAKYVRPGIVDMFDIENNVKYTVPELVEKRYPGVQQRPKLINPHVGVELQDIQLAKP